MPPGLLNGIESYNLTRAAIASYLIARRLFMTSDEVPQRDVHPELPMPSGCYRFGIYGAICGPFVLLPIGAEIVFWLIGIAVAPIAIGWLNPKKRLLCAWMFNFAFTLAPTLCIALRHRTSPTIGDSRDLISVLIVAFVLASVASLISTRVDGRLNSD